MFFPYFGPCWRMRSPVLNELTKAWISLVAYIVLSSGLHGEHKLVFLPLPILPPDGGVSLKLSTNCIKLLEMSSFLRRDDLPLATTAKLLKIVEDELIDV